MKQKTPPKSEKSPEAHSAPDNEAVQFSPLTMDWQEFAHLLEDSDLTDDQKREFIEILLNIVTAFVDLGFGTHPVQQACEQKGTLGHISALDLAGLIESENSIRQRFEGRAHKDGLPESEGGHP